ncbi:hypothetical protein Pryu01_00856 [Paraliobacillus ryukyuensis]|uniref:Putative cell wall-binding protein n=1 Tax=Paraliobacillus ryukyuensis TaxID=200904 RepID=A0A366EDT5_9BACI|nr:cell wall-binding repeat-containing protein [Paraliobacillus ryukyuensis]RBP00571.1 putative cell wall-binding protein [Paraliobacillus ryukyuensis]
MIKKLYLHICLLFITFFLGIGTIQTEAEEIKYEFHDDQQVLPVEPELEVEVNNGQLKSMLSITQNDRVLFNKELVLTKVNGMQTITENDEQYLVIEYRVLGSAQELYFGVLHIKEGHMEEIFVSEAYQHGTIQIDGTDIAISYPTFDENDINTEPTNIVDIHFTIENGQVNEGIESIKQYSDNSPLSTIRLMASTSVDEKYTNPSYQTISAILTEEALKQGVPPEILKAIAFQESGWQQYWLPGQTPVNHYTNKCTNWDGTNVKLGYDCIGIGIMQVSDYRFMENETEKATEIEKLSTDIRYNIQEGIKILKQKWNYANAGLIPTINEQDRTKLENWYFAIMAYNGLSSINNPLNNPVTAYQERIYQHIKNYGLVESIIPFPTHQLTPNQSGILSFEEDHIQIPTSLTSTTHAFEVNQSVYVTASQLVVRLSPSGPAIGSFQKGDQLRITGSPSYLNKNISHFAWYPVTANGISGYVAASYLNEAKQIVTALEGERRYETSASISNYGWHWNNQKSVIIGRGDQPIDALTGSVIAGYNRAPLLLTKQTELPAEIKTELVRLQPRHYTNSSYTIYIMGGAEAVSAQVEREITQLVDASIVRLSGETRYDTAYEIASYMIKQVPTQEIFLTTGDASSPDALSIAPYASKQSIPILLTKKDRLQDQVKTFIKENGINKVTIVGGPDVISPQIEQTLEQQVSIVDRISGEDRFETSVAVAKQFYPKSLQTIMFARGDMTVDALSGAALASQYQAPIILTKRDAVPNSVTTWLETRKVTPNYVYFGGPEAITNQTRQQLQTLVAN